MTEACEQACRWSPSIQLGVNCTIHQLRRGEVSKAVAAALEQTGFRSGQLTLEVTEDAIVDPSASADLKHLSQMGVQLSVDDVGTNWSSFEPFKRHSISTVKIDGSFIAGLESTQGINRLVVETVIHMAHSLGMSAIVEAVETAAQVEIVPVVQGRRRPGLLLRPADVGRATPPQLAGGPGRAPVLPYRDPDTAPSRRDPRGHSTRRGPRRGRAEIADSDRHRGVAAGGTWRASETYGSERPRRSEPGRRRPVPAPSCRAGDRPEARPPPGARTDRPTRPDPIPDARR